jgi:hypothetical protein
MITTEQEELFDYVKTSLGAPYRPVLIDNDTLCTLMTFCVKEYQKHITRFITLQNWPQLYGKNLLNTQEIAWSVTTRNFDYAKQFSYWYSKEAGLQSNGPFELKKDYVIIEKGKQDYLIPAGRMINSVLYLTPGTTDSAIWAGYGGFGGTQLGFGSVGSAGGMMGWGGGAFGSAFGGMYVMPAYDTALLSADLNMKQKMLGGELTYKVTAGPDGTHILHLINLPGAKFDFNAIGRKGFECSVWYTYYDVSGGDADECARLNSDVLLSPDQFPIKPTLYEFMNPQAKQSIQTLLLAKAKQTEGYILAYSSGEIPIPDGNLKIDYNVLIQDGKDEWKSELEDLNKWLELLSPVNQLKNQADMLDSLMKVLSGNPQKIFIG